MKFLRGYFIVFILLWLLALIFTLPAQTIVPLLPEDRRPVAASGTVWNGKFSELRWKNIALTYVTWYPGWYNGVPGLRIGARGTIGEGDGFVSWLGGWRLDDTRWLMSTTALQPVIAASALPVEASGTLALRIERLHMRHGVCSALAASVTWRDASLALGGPPLQIGTPTLALECQPEGIGFTLQQ